MNYTYDPSKMMDGGKDQMRFELQDIAINGAEETCVLSDEEYDAILNKAGQDGRDFRWAKYQCLNAIMMRMAYEVDFSADGLSISLSQRYERWKALKDSLEEEIQGKYPYTHRDTFMAFHCGNTASSKLSCKFMNFIGSL